MLESVWDTQYTMKQNMHAIFEPRHLLLVFCPWQLRVCVFAGGLGDVEHWISDGRDRVPFLDGFNFSHCTAIVFLVNPKSDSSTTQDSEVRPHTF